MKKSLKWIFVNMTILLSYNVFAQTNSVDQQQIYVELRSQMERACPIAWEDLGAEMNTEQLSDDPWSGNQTDKGQFLALLQEIMAEASTDDIAVMAGDVATVATECASHRVALLDALISKTPRDVLLAMDAVNKGLNKSIEYLDGGWTTGDVRITGRLVPQDGWVFLVGQTVGNASSSANLTGDDFNELYELAKNWAPNSGNENWSEGHLVTLPDMRGRSVVAADNMGGASKGVSTDAQADIIGGEYGNETTTLSVANLPSHDHEMTDAGSHTHPIQYAGNHTHLQKASTYTGTSKWGYHDYGGEVRGRTRAEVTLTKSIQAGGNHIHPMSPAGTHAHNIGSTGGGEPVANSQPNIVFNMEMKY